MSTHRTLLREATAADAARLYAINVSAAPGVGQVTTDELQRLVGIGALTLVAERDDAVQGFILCMTEGVDYASGNYRWIAERYPAFAYCDRIAIAPEARGHGLGDMLYREAWRRLGPLRRLMLCEVNLEPPNPGSLRFHQRIGFRPVGEAWTSDRSYGVVYLERPIP